MNLVIRLSMIFIAGTIVVPASYGQYYYKLFFEDEIKFGRAFSVVEESNDCFVFDAGIIHDSSRFESKILFKNCRILNNQILKDFSNKEVFTTLLGKALKFDGENYFYLNYDFNTSVENTDSVGWNYLVLDKDGKQLVNKKILIKPIAAAPNYSHGIEFIKNNQVILWGSANNPDSDPNVLDLHFIWFKLKKDGTLLSGPHYFKPIQKLRIGNTGDAGIDIDSNMVFVYDAYDIPNEKYLFKIYEDDSVKQIIKIPYVSRDERYLPKMVLTNDNSFVVTSHLPQNNEGIEVIKINRSGNILWKQNIEVLRGDFLNWVNGINTRSLYISRIIEAKNGDIVICGGNSVADDFYNHQTDKKEFSASTQCSFMVRISSSGNLLWKHFLVIMDTTVHKLARIALRDVIETSDGDLVFTGDYGISMNPTKFVPFMMKVGPNGCFDKLCSNVDKYWYFPEGFSSSLNMQAQKESLAIYPNPGFDFVRLSIPKALLSNASLQYMITDFKGQIFMNGLIEPNNLALDTQFIPSGTYIISIMDRNGKLWYGKWIKV